MSTIIVTVVAPPPAYISGTARAMRPGGLVATAASRPVSTTGVAGSGADDRQPEAARRLRLTHVEGEKRNGRTADALRRRQVQRIERSLSLIHI